MPCSPAGRFLLPTLLLEVKAVSLPLGLMLFLWLNLDVLTWKLQLLGSASIGFHPGRCGTKFQTVRLALILSPSPKWEMPLFILACLELKEGGNMGNSFLSVFLNVSSFVILKAGTKVSHLISLALALVVWCMNIVQVGISVGRYCWKILFSCHLHCVPHCLSLILFFCGTWIWTQGFMPTKAAFYSLSHTSSPIYSIQC
jgi:hypothetical protein